MNFFKTKTNFKNYQPAAGDRIVIERLYKNESIEVLEVTGDRVKILRECGSKVSVYTDFLRDKRIK